MSFPRNGGTRVRVQRGAAPGRVRPLIRYVAIALIASLPAAGLAGCSRDEPANDPTATLSPSPTSTTSSTSITRPTLSAAVLNGFTPQDQISYVMDVYWDEWVQLGQHPDMNRTSYFSLLTGGALAFKTETLSKEFAAGQAWRLPDRSRFAHSIVRIAVNGTTATVYECVVDDAVVYDVADGAVRNDKTATVLIRNTLTKAAGVWQISESVVVDQKEGEQPCASP
jgi:hypothetical protein